jgi:hypothetical protein
VDTENTTTGPETPCAYVGRIDSQPPADASPVSATASDDPVAVQVERVETLLAAVRDIVSSLGATSAQLEREVAQALGQALSTATADPVHGSGRDALEAERAALHEAVEHRAVIEQAKGMLMLKHRCAADDAFGLLREISRRERRKVRDIAADLVRAGSRPRALVDLTADQGSSPAGTRPAGPRPSG